MQNIFSSLWALPKAEMNTWLRSSRSLNTVSLWRSMSSRSFSSWKLPRFLLFEELCFLLKFLVLMGLLNNSYLFSSHFCFSSLSRLDVSSIIELSIDSIQEAKGYSDWSLSCSLSLLLERLLGLTGELLSSLSVDYSFLCDVSTLFSLFGLILLFCSLST